MITAIILCANLLKATLWHPITFSVYSPSLHGSKLASRGFYDRNKMTCASNDHKLYTILEIKNGTRTCTVTVRDRMAKRFTGKRIDLSSAAMRKLGMKYGLLKGQYRVVSTP